MATRSRTDVQSMTSRTLAATINSLPRLALMVAALLLFAGAAHAQVFVSNYGSGYVENCTEDGASCQTHFIDSQGYSEGIACVKLSSNKMYVANNGNVIYVYTLSGSPLTGDDITLPSNAQIAALTLDVTASRLYAADYGGENIYTVDLGGGPCSSYCVEPTSAAHDVVVGPDGDVYATEWDNNTGVIAFRPVSGSTGLVPDTAKYGANGIFISNSQLANAGGMVFDGSGNFWLTSAGGTTDGIYEYAGPASTNPARGTLLNSVADAGAFPLGLDVSPLNPAGPPVDPCTGCIVVAEFNKHQVSQINPTLCTGGTCTLRPYIMTSTLKGNDTSTPKPKYVHFLEDCCDTGYVEICKLTCVYNQVSGFFNFTASNAGDVIGPLSVPVNACSGPIQIPNGTVNIKEAQQLGVVLDGVAAYDYDYFGNQINALLSENLPFTNANVNVVSGDISTETVVGFTNCLSGEGELKICKVAGSNDLLNKDFMFSVKTFGPPVSYTVPAGPAPGGYCVVAGNYQAGTPVLVTEPTGQNNSQASNITVEPANRQGTTTQNSVVAVIDSGTTEVTFTNVDAGCNGENLLTNGSFETGDFTGWTQGGNFEDSQVVSGPFYQFTGAEDGSFYATFGSVGTPATLSQRLPTVRGQTYHVCFWLNAVGDVPSFFGASWDMTPFLSLSNPTTGGVWTEYVRGAFTAVGNDTLTFTVMDDPGYIALDNVVVSSP